MVGLQSITFIAAWVFFISRHHLQLCLVYSWSPKALKTTRDAQYLLDIMGYFILSLLADNEIVI